MITLLCTGIVMLMLDTRMEPAVAKSMVQGAPDTLHSEFHLSYTMLLNLMLSEALAPEALLRKSFRQFQTERSLPTLRLRSQQLEVAISHPCIVFNPCPAPRLGSSQEHHPSVASTLGSLL
jgi:superfamily II RNA helicase